MRITSFVSDVFAAVADMVTFNKLFIKIRKLKTAMLCKVDLKLARKNSSLSYGHPTYHENERLYSLREVSYHTYLLSPTSMSTSPFEMKFELEEIKLTENAAHG